VVWPVVAFLCLILWRRCLLVRTVFYWGRANRKCSSQQLFVSSIRVQWKWVSIWHIFYGVYLRGKLWKELLCPQRIAWGHFRNESNNITAFAVHAVCRVK
jgi:hypothetical protein